jgi:hypothetical protein
VHFVPLTVLQVFQHTSDVQNVKKTYPCGLVIKLNGADLKIKQGRLHRSQMIVKNKLKKLKN